MDITEISTPWYDGLKNGQKSGVDTAASPEASQTLLFGQKPTS